MQGKLVCVLAIFAIVAAMTLSEVEACKHCGYSSCTGCESAHVIPITIPSPSYSLCGSCGQHCGGHSHYPRQYCNPCLRRKLYRLNNNCDSCC